MYRYLMLFQFFQNGRMGEKAVLRIAYSYKKFDRFYKTNQTIIE